MPVKKNSHAVAAKAPTKSAASRLSLKNAKAGKAAKALSTASSKAATSDENNEVPFPLAHRFERLQQLGHGTSGVVWLVRRKSDQQLLAMKSITLPSVCSREEKAISERRQAMREVEALQQIRSSYVVRYFDMVMCPPTVANPRCELHILTEYCEAGDLATYIKDRATDGGLTEDEVWWLATSVLIGLNELHERGILHRDLKPANILLRKHSSGGEVGASSKRTAHDLAALVGDLGLTRIISESQPLANTMLGTPHYCAPEIFEGTPYNHKADIYSFGVCVYELMHGKTPYADAENILGLVRRVLRLDLGGSSGLAQSAPLDAKFSQELRSFVTSCLERDPDLRPDSRILFDQVPRTYALANRGGPLKRSEEAKIDEVPSSAEGHGRKKAEQPGFSFKPALRRPSVAQEPSADAVEDPDASVLASIVEEDVTRGTVQEPSSDVLADPHPASSNKELAKDDVPLLKENTSTPCEESGKHENKEETMKVGKSVSDSAEDSVVVADRVVVDLADVLRAALVHDSERVDADDRADPAGEMSLHVDDICFEVSTTTALGSPAASEKALTEANLTLTLVPQPGVAPVVGAATSLVEATVSSLLIDGSCMDGNNEGHCARFVREQKYQKPNWGQATRKQGQCQRDVRSYVARAQECWSKWRRERQDAKVVVSPPVSRIAAGAGGRNKGLLGFGRRPIAEGRPEDAQVLRGRPCTGLSETTASIESLQIQGFAPLLTPKPSRQVCRI